MGSPFIGEIRMFAGIFAPVGWAFCNGAIQNISENETLFNLIGTTYGGDGQTTFALPNLQGRVPVHQGTSGGTPYSLGQMGGVEQVTLTVNTIPSHTHVPLANTGNTGTSPSGMLWAGNPDLAQFAVPDSVNGQMNNQIVQASGGSQPHNNMVPYLAINFIISLFGIYPSQ